MVLSVALNLIPGVVGHLLGFAALWPQICIHAKRLHDMGRTAWWMLLPALVLIAGGLVSYALGYSETGQMSAVAMAHLVFAAICGIGFLLWVGLTPGKPEPNRFGPAFQGAAG